MRGARNSLLVILILASVLEAQDGSITSDHTASFIEADESGLIYSNHYLWFSFRLPESVSANFSLDTLPVHGTASRDAAAFGPPFQLLLAAHSPSAAEPEEAAPANGCAEPDTLVLSTRDVSGEFRWLRTGMNYFQGERGAMVRGVLKYSLRESARSFTVAALPFAHASYRNEIKQPDGTTSWRYTVKAATVVASHLVIFSFSSCDEARAWELSKSVNSFQLTEAPKLLKAEK